MSISRSPPPIITPPFVYTPTLLSRLRSSHHIHATQASHEQLVGMRAASCGWISFGLALQICALPGWGRALTMPKSCQCVYDMELLATTPVLSVSAFVPAARRVPVPRLPPSMADVDCVVLFQSLHTLLSSSPRRVRCRPYQRGVERDEEILDVGDRKAPTATTLPRTLRAIDSVLSRTTRRMIVQCAGRLLCLSLSDQRSLRHPPSSAIFIVILRSLVATVPCPSPCNVPLGIVCPWRSLSLLPGGSSFAMPSSVATIGVTLRYPCMSSSFSLSLLLSYRHPASRYVDSPTTRGIRRAPPRPAPNDGELLVTTPSYPRDAASMSRQQRPFALVVLSFSVVSVERLLLTIPRASHAHPSSLRGMMLLRPRCARLDTLYMPTADVQRVDGVDLKCVQMMMPISTVFQWLGARRGLDGRQRSSMVCCAAYCRRSRSTRWPSRVFGISPLVEEEVDGSHDAVFCQDL
ncbi:hypothetical protein C8R46DRAFT_1320322 [Mycena filopes]|nr:hypothetical protein C8R46DRAFT_1320322 [Mycena filopes]